MALVLCSSCYSFFFSRFHFPLLASLLSPLLSFPSSTFDTSRWWYSASSLSANIAPFVASWQSSSAVGNAVNVCRSLWLGDCHSGDLHEQEAQVLLKLLFIFLLIRPVKDLSDWQRVLNITRGINYLLWCMGFGRTSCTHFYEVTQPAGRGWCWFRSLLSDKKLGLEMREHISKQDNEYWSSRSWVWMPNVG